MDLQSRCCRESSYKRVISTRSDLAVAVSLIWTLLRRTLPKKYIKNTQQKIKLRGGLLGALVFEAKVILIAELSPRTTQLQHLNFQFCNCPWAFQSMHSQRYTQGACHGNPTHPHPHAHPLSLSTLLQVDMPLWAVMALPHKFCPIFTLAHP